MLNYNLSSYPGRFASTVESSAGENGPGIGWSIIYLAIRLRARNFYEVIVNEGEAQVNYRFIEIESE